MYDDHVFQPGRAATTSSGLTSSLPAVTEPFLVAKAPQPAVQISNTTLILVPFGLLALWTIASLCFNQRAKQPNTAQQQNEYKLIKRVPCRQCLFFKNNPYLKCAIHPSEALTADAINCTDYVSHADRRHKS